MSDNRGFNIDEDWAKDTNWTIFSSTMGHIVATTAGQTVHYKEIVSALEPKRWWHYLGVKRKTVDFELNFDVMDYLSKGTKPK